MAKARVLIEVEFDAETLEEVQATLKEVNVAAFRLAVRLDRSNLTVQFDVREPLVAAMPDYTSSPEGSS